MTTCIGGKGKERFNRWRYCLVDKGRALKILDKHAIVFNVSALGHSLRVRVQCAMTTSCVQPFVNPCKHTLGGPTYKQIQKEDL